MKRLSRGAVAHSQQQETYQDCASSLTALVDAATGASQSLSLTVESVAKIHGYQNLPLIVTTHRLASIYTPEFTSAIVFPDVFLERSL